MARGLHLTWEGQYVATEGPARAYSITSAGRGESKKFLSRSEDDGERFRFHMSSDLRKLH